MNQEKTGEWGSEGNPKTSLFIFPEKGGGRIYRPLWSACFQVCYQLIK